MRRIAILFLQAVIVLIGVTAIIFMLRFPLTEGKAKNLNLFSIYTDPFILYGYVSSIAFFVGLYKAFKLLKYIRQDKLFSQNSVKILRSIKYCTIMVGGLIVIAGLYIMIFHNKDDDPAGFLAMCIITIFIAIAVAAALTILERILQNVIDRKTKNHITM